MNRRHFLALTLPALLGGAASAALAQEKPAPTAPRRVKIELSLLGPSLKIGSTTAHVVTVITEENVEAYASFLQMYTFKENEAEHTVNTQAFGPYLRVTPHIEADGRIKIEANFQYEEASLAAEPNKPLPVASTSVTFTHLMESGKPLIVGSALMEGAQAVIQVTATLLAMHPAVG